MVDTINNGTTLPTAFTLSNPGGYVSAGPYAYTLFRGSRDSSNEQAWYLRSTINCSQTPTDPLCASSITPNYRPQVSLYTAMPAMALIFGTTFVDTLHDRVGEEEDLRFGSRINENWSGTWGRVIGQYGHNDGDDLGIYRSGPEFDYNLQAIQIGHDFYRREYNNGGRDHVGLYGGAGQLTGNVNHIVNQQSAGTNSLTNYSLAAYWTHFGPTGWYWDGILQGSRYDTKAESPFMPSLQTRGNGLVASLEGGYPFLYQEDLVLEPQAQFIYETINLDNASDLAATVKFRDIDSSIGRLGLRLAKTWQWDRNATYKRFTAWIRPNFWHNFQGSPKTLFSYAGGFLPFGSEIGGNWLGINLGANAKVSEAISLYANANYQNRITGNTSYAYNLEFGVRAAW